MKQEEIQNQLKMLDAWKEAYWNAMRDGSVSKLDQSKLDFLSKKLNLTEEDKNKVIASFERNETEFVELINEIFKNNSANNLDLEELEHIDYIRQECCISEKEASELLQQKTFNNKIIEHKDKITFEWIRNLIPDKEQTVVNEIKQEEIKPELRNYPIENSKKEESPPSNYTKIHGFEFILVEGGEFTMGDKEFKEATPHKVKLDSFYIGKYPVTQEQWMDIMGNNPSAGGKQNNKKPVNTVSWHDCQEFIKKLNIKTNKNFRLPTEAEWEYAARGGKMSRGYKYAGSDDINDVAWYEKNSDNYVHKVGQKKPNELDIYDMSGNIYEWCSDWYGEYYYRKSVYNNPKGPLSGEYRVLRGGSWSHDAGYCLVAYRFDGYPDDGNDFRGFRLLSPVE
jgi:formylglycine-generating enzyme required for sulfatase activity